ncbi:MAG: 4fe-4s binding domain [Myxococcaceae bacterium]|nr:4fe-4s binding domain [Myxococcaceae bacterium]
MEPERLPLLKVLDSPFLSLDGTSVEMASLLFLFLAVLVVAGTTWQRQWTRRAVQAVSAVVFFYVVYSCLGVFGMLRNAFHGTTLLGSVYSESCFWMALPVVAASVTGVAGPVFCGWICPTGALQDLAVALRNRLPKLRARATGPRLLVLGAVCLVFLALLVWLSVEKKMFVEDSSLHWAMGVLALCYLVVAGLVDDQAIRGLRLLSVGVILVTAVSRQLITSPTHFAFSSRGDPASALATLIIVLSSLLVSRAFCRYLCPWGAVTGLLARFSRLKIAHDAARCDGCNACNRSCAVQAVELGQVQVDQCQLCFACIDDCPKSALSLVDTWKPAPRPVETAPQKA